MTTPRVLVGVASLQMVDVNFAMALVRLAHKSAKAGLGLVIQPVVQHTIANAHNMIVEAARAQNCTHVFFVETDNTFPPDALLRLLAHEKDIVGCTYLTRSKPHWTMGRELDETRAIDVTGGGVREVKNLPLGCALVSMRVFDAISEALGGQDKPIFYEKWSDELRRYGTDDYPFYARAREAGFSVWCDCSLSMEVGHIASIELRLTDDKSRAVDPWRQNYKDMEHV